MISNLDFIAETFPESKIAIESCYKGWFGAGGFE